MRRVLVESKFLELVDGRLSDAERAEALRAIEADPILSRRFSQYQALLELEQEVRDEKIELSRGFVVKVMERLEEAKRPFLWGLIMKHTKTTVALAGGIVSIAALYITLPDRSTDIFFNEESIPTLKPSLSATQSGIHYSEDIIAEDVPNKPSLEPIDTEHWADYDPSIAREARKLKETKFDSSAGLVGRMPMPPMTSQHSAIRFREYGENSRQQVSSAPVSTFSIDVDTASYTNMRRFISEGTVPPRESIRTEEFLNYFTYSYPKQFEKPFSVYSEVAPSPFHPDRYLLKLGINAKEMQQRERPWNLVFLVDVSGSMEQTDKLGLLKPSLKLLASKMGAQDRVSIVTYAGAAEAVLENAGINQREEILAKIDHLGGGGSTNGEGGIHEAYAIAKRHFMPNAENRVVLATDGDFNVGVSSDEELIRLIEEKRKQGVTLTTLGFGHDNLNDSMLEQLANKGNGNYFFIDSFREARKVFEQSLFSTIETVAKDVKVQVEFNPERISSYRLIGYDNRMLRREDFTNDQIDAGETGAGHTVTVLYEVALAGTRFANETAGNLRYTQGSAPTAVPTASELSRELAFVKIRYKDPAGSQSKELSFPVDQSSVRTGTGTGSQDLKFAASVAAFASVLRQSIQEPAVPLDVIARVARENMGEDRDGYRREFVQLVESAKSLGAGSTAALSK